MSEKARAFYTILIGPGWELNPLYRFVYRRNVKQCMLKFFRHSLPIKTVIFWLPLRGQVAIAAWNCCRKAMESYLVFIRHCWIDYFSQLMFLCRRSLPIHWNNRFKVSEYRNGTIESFSVHIMEIYWNCLFFRWYMKGNLVTVKHKILVICRFLRIIMKKLSENCATCPQRLYLLRHKVLQNIILKWYSKKL